MASAELSRRVEKVVAYSRSLTASRASRESVSTYRTILPPPSVKIRR